MAGKILNRHGRITTNTNNAGKETQIMSQIISRPSSTEVRLWAVANGLASPTRGRLSQHAVDEFNKAHRLFGARAYTGNDRVRRHTVKPDKGRTITRNYRVADARAWAIAQGFCEVGTRGRMSKELLDAFILSGS